MEEQISRKVMSIGNGAHIFVPREWLHEIVYITKPKQSLNDKILSIISPHFENIKGVYLYGSRARNEHEKDSDIDLFIITSKKIKIKSKSFEIISINENEIEKAIKLNPILIYSILSEAKPIINSSLLEELRNKYKPKLRDFAEFLKDTQKLIKINKDILESEKEKNTNEGVPYSIILRLRGIFIINHLLSEKTCSNKEFREWIKNDLPNINLKSVYLSYKAVKTNSKTPETKTNDLKQLLNLLEKEIEKLLNKLK